MIENGTDAGGTIGAGIDEIGAALGVTGGALDSACGAALERTGAAIRTEPASDPISGAAVCCSVARTALRRRPRRDAAAVGRGSGSSCNHAGSAWFDSSRAIKSPRNPPQPIGRDATKAH
jgi:hypothetical protein